jgi:DNA-binding transcriptional LysR family regulator
MAEFAARYPLVRYSLEIRSRRDVGQWIAGQQFDLGIAALPIDAPAVTSQPFASVAVAAILPRGHRLAEKSRLDARDLVGEPFIALNPLALLRHRIDSLFADLGLPLSVRAETSSGLSACQLAAKGLGVTLADPLVARCLAPGQIEVREWDPGLRLTYGFLYSTAHAPSALVLDFADTVARAAKQMEPAAVELLGVGR